MMQSLATKFPELSKEWHPKNKLAPSEVSYGSEARVWWVCNYGHEWQSPICRRSSGKTGCPYCANQKVCLDNCLATNAPKLAKEWHPKNKLTPYEVVTNSNRKVWWICCNGHEWQASVVQRSKINTRCPYCSNRKVCLDNCLATNVPKLVKEWHPKNKLTPYEVLPNSHKKVLWICSNGHEWISSIANRSCRGCPYCANQKVCLENCLAINFPDLIKEWHPKNNLTPYQYVSGSCKKCWWICGSCNTSWQATPAKRTKGTGCPVCKSSRGERKIFEWLKWRQVEFSSQHKFNDCKNKHHLPFDFFVPSYNLCIEFYGEQHYKPIEHFGGLEKFEQTRKRDAIKVMYCKNNGLRLLIIPFWDIGNVPILMREVCGD